MQISMTTPARLYTHDGPGSGVLASRASASFSSAMSHRRELKLEAPDAIHADLNQTPGTDRVAELALDRVAIPLLAVVEPAPAHRSEEHTSELQSRENLVCRLLLEKKKTQ